MSQRPQSETERAGGVRTRFPPTAVRGEGPHGTPMQEDAGRRTTPVAAIVVNYRTPDLTLDCLRSLEGEVATLPGTRVVVVDNSSGDDSADRIEAGMRRHQWTSWAILLRSPTNGGFAAGYNRGLRAVAAESYLILNSDTIVRPGAIVQLLEALQRRPDAGIIAPRLEGSDGTPQASCFHFIRPAHAFLTAARTGLVSRWFRDAAVAIPVSDEPCEPDWTSFACVLLRGTLVREIGLLDEGYFMYFEDVDYCRRARAAGRSVVYWPKARVVHLRGGSSPVKALTAARKRRPRYYYASRARYYAKFYGRAGLVFANLLWTAGRSIALVREAGGGKAPHTCEKEGTDNWTNWRTPLADREAFR